MKRVVLSSVLLVGAVPAGLASAAPIMLDFDTTRLSGTSTAGTTDTQPGFTSFDVTDNPEGASITVDGATLMLFGGITATGSRNRPLTPAITGHPYEALLRDFVFRDGDAGAVALRISGLAPGIYDVQSFHFDADPTIPGVIQIESRLQGVAGSTVILHDQVPFSTDPYSYQFTVLEGDAAVELVFRDDGTQNRSRLNGIIISPAVPEPSTAAMLAVAALGVTSRRRR